MLEVMLGALVFTAVVMTLVLVVLGARALLAPTGNVTVRVNEERSFEAPIETSLFEALADAGIALPAACGGRGTCGLCRLRVLSGGGAASPLEVDLLSREAVAGGERLACQLVLRSDLEVRVPEEVLGAEEYRCRVRSNRNVATFIKELVLELPPHAELEFRAGAFVQLHCPPFQTRFHDFDVDEAFRPAWDELGLWRLEVGSSHPVRRAYSLANHPGEEGILRLDVRIATPPPTAPPSVPPGVVSSYVFQLKPGDEVTVSGPFGHFFAEESDREMVLVGGGAGMAPMRAHVFDQLERLRAKRTIGFWYGARSLSEVFYAEDFDALQEAHENFRWVVALSEAKPEDHWDGAVGFVHEVLYEQYLKDHPSPESCEYYLCGPPMMIQATRSMLVELGVEEADIHYDDFGG